MLIKFESNKASPFIMRSETAKQILVMAGLGGDSEGSISGNAISQAITSLGKALSEQAEIPQVSIDEDELDTISLDARAAPLSEMLRHALQIDSYVMWRPE